MLDYKYRTILSVAVPLMASSFIQSIVMITDSSFLSRYSTVDFDAAGNAGLIYVTLYIAMMGMNDGAQIFMARRIGEGRIDLLPGVFGTSLLTNLVMAFSLLLFAQLIIPDIISHYSRHLDIAEGQIAFIKIRSYGLLFSMITLSINAYFMAIGKTTVVMLSSIIIAGSNVFLDYSLIFGNYGFPELGLKGAALASCLADGIAMVVLVIMLIIHEEARAHQMIKKITVRKTAIFSLIKLGSPILLQGVIALLVWTVFFFWIEQMGKYELTVSQNIRSIYFLAFVPIWGFAATTKTYISQYVGHKSFDEIKIIQRRILLLTMTFLLAVIHGSFLYPEALISVINPEPEFLKGSAETLRFISGSIFIFGLFSVYINTVSGSGNTRFTFLIEVIAVGLYLFFAYLFIKVYHWEIKWIWGVEYIYFIAMGSAAMFYLKFFNWKKKIL